MNRRQWLLAASALATATHSAWAQDGRYPDRPIRIVVPFSAGGGGDSVARLLASKLPEVLGGGSTIVENRVGAGGNIGTESALRSPPDGYTLLVVSGTYASQAVATKLSFDPLAAITPLTQLTQETSVLVVNANSPIRSLADLVARAKAAPGTVSYGSAGAGGLAHFATEQVAMIAGIKLNHIPYKGTGAALNDLLGGTIDTMFGGTASMAPHVRSGKLRALATTGSRRGTSLSDVPTFAEAGVPADIPLLWHAVVAPRGLPDALAAKLQSAIAAAMATKDVAQRLAHDAIEPAVHGPARLLELIRHDMAVWRKVATAIDFKPE